MQQNFHRNFSFSAPAGGGFLFSKIFAIINKISLPFTAKNLYFCPFTNIVGNMKTRIFLLSLSLLLAMTLQAQTYPQLWKNVEQMGQQDLPKSVIAEANKIYQKAKAERNVPQMMKAYLTMMEWRGSISPDSVAVDVKGLEAWAQEPDLAVQDKAVLHSILGEPSFSSDVIIFQRDSCSHCPQLHPGPHSNLSLPSWVDSSHLESPLVVVSVS